jgi:hypothetical protein
MLFIDAPEHTRLRKLMNRGFSPAGVESLRPRVEVIVDSMLEPLLQGEPCRLTQPAASQKRLEAGMCNQKRGEVRSMMSTSTAVVTGVSAGIGFEIAKTLSDKGFHVFGSVRKTSADLEKSSRWPIHTAAI